MGEERTGHRLAHQQADQRMPGESGAGVGIHRPGQRLVDTQGLLAAAVGLARHVDDGQQRALARRLAVGLQRLVDGGGQAPALEQPDLALASARERIVGIGHDGQETHRVAVQLGIGDAQRSRIAGTRREATGQRLEPGQATGSERLAHVASPWPSPWYSRRTPAASGCSAVSRSPSRRR